jgi:hypothetical protein
MRSRDIEAIASALLRLASCNVMSCEAIDAILPSFGRIAPEPAPAHDVVAYFTAHSTHGFDPR